MVRDCAKCGGELPVRQGRGRPRKYCDACLAPKPIQRATVHAGERFDLLTVLETTTGSRSRAPVLCDCGSRHDVSVTNLRSGGVKSCGCLRHLDYGGGRTLHGLSKTPEYAAWANIRQRIFNSACHAYPGYGGRGLTMEPDWAESAEAFIADVGLRPSPELSIDRIDNDLGYVRGNVRWATAKQQSNNTRRNVAA